MGSIEKNYSSSAELRSLSLPYKTARMHAEQREAQSVAVNIVLLARFRARSTADG